MQENRLLHNIYTYTLRDSENANVEIGIRCNVREHKIRKGKNVTVKAENTRLERKKERSGNVINRLDEFTVLPFNK